MPILKSDYTRIKYEMEEAKSIVSEFVKMQNDPSYGDLVWRLAVKEKAESFLRRNGRKL